MPVGFVDDDFSMDMGQVTDTADRPSMAGASAGARAGAGATEPGNNVAGSLSSLECPSLIDEARWEVAEQRQAALNQALDQGEEKAKEEAKGKQVELRVEEGDDVNKGDPLLVLSAMKMETIVAAPAAGRVQRIVAGVKDSMSAGDLLVEIDC